MVILDKMVFKGKYVLLKGMVAAVTVPQNR